MSKIIGVFPMFNTGGICVHAIDDAEDKVLAYTKRFWVPEAFVSMFGQMSIIRMDDGTKPE